MTEAAEPADFDAEVRRLIEADSLPLDLTPQELPVPGLLIRRASHFTESMVGRRARFLLTSHDEQGAWLAHGWKDGLRIVSGAPAAVEGLGEPALWVQEEREFYGSCCTVNRFAVGVSRVWVEQYVTGSTTRRAQSQPSAAWVDSLNTNPNLPELRDLHPAEGHPDPIGARVVLVHADGDLEVDLRAVTPVRMTDGGELAIAVLSERDWYRWSEHKYGHAPHPTLRWAPAARIWVE